MKTLFSLCLFFLSLQLTAQKSVMVRMDGRNVEFKKNNENALCIDINNHGNIFMGNNAGKNTFIDTTNIVGGESNIFMGSFSGFDNTSGSHNNFIGSFSGTSNTIGRFNSFFGNSAGSGNTTGYGNTALGQFAYGIGKTGYFNLAAGYHAGSKLTIGSQNIFLGSFSGGDMIADSMSNYSIYIGSYSGAGLAGNNQLFISHSSAPKPNPLIWGHFEEDSVKVYGTFGIGDEYVLPNADGFPGQYLRTNGAGQTQWVDLPAHDQPDELKDEDGDTYVTVEGTPDDDLIRFGVDDSAAMTIAKNIKDQTGIIIPSNNVCLGHLPDDLDPANGNVGVKNTIVGHETGNGLTLGHNNALLGYQAGKQLTSGHQNTLIGSGAGDSFSKGKLNVVVGYEGGSQYIGDENTIVGAKAGQNGKGFGNILLGHAAGQNNTKNDRLYIDNNATPTPLIYGNLAQDSLIVNGSLSVGSAYTFPQNTGGNKQVLTSNGNGQASWQSIPTATDLSDSDGDTRVRVEKTPDNDDITFEVAGTTFLTLKANADGVNYIDWDGQGSNMLIGSSFNNLDVTNVSGLRNTAIGTLSNLNLDSGTDNTTLGYQAGLIIGDGDYNTFVGSLTGSGISGSRNTALGYRAGSGNSSDLSTYIGYRAGYNSDGDGNIFIGADAGSNMVGDSMLVIDNTDTDSPLLHGYFEEDSLELNATVLLRTPETDHPLKFETIEFVNGLTSETAIVPLANGFGRIGNIDKTIGRGYFHILSASQFSNSSDQRLKDDVRPLENGVSTLMQLKSYEYLKYPSLDWKNSKNTSRIGPVHEYGFIAQEIQEILPHLVSAHGEEEILAVNYIGLIPHTVKAIQEQQETIEAQASKISSLEQELAKQEQRLARLEQLLDK